MRFAYTPEQEALRREVRDFIAKEVTPEVKAEMEAHNEGHAFTQMMRFALDKTKAPNLIRLFEKIAERGWVGMSFPKEYGGQGKDRVSQYIVEEELYRANISVTLSGSGAPAILAAGTEEQKRYFVPRLITGELSFALGFTEPRGGADLAALQCRAIPDGDFYVINGQKMYTSYAQFASHIYLMARTNKDAPTHSGISIFLVPMDTPGITVRPLLSVQNDPPSPQGTTLGHHRTNETFFEDVRVHKSTLLGEANKGWGIGAMALNIDRVGAWRYLITVMRDEDIVNWVKESDGLGGRSPADDPAIRDKIAELWIEAQVCRLMTMRSMSIVEHGGHFTYEGSADKVWAPEHGVRTTEAISQMLGAYGQLLNGSPHAISDGVYAHNLMSAYQNGVNHGSVQVMRDQIATRGLGLPRGGKTKKK